MKHVMDNLDTLTLKGYLNAKAGLEDLTARAADHEDGQATAEYVAVIVLIAAVIGIVVTLGDDIGAAIRDAVVAAFERVSTLVSGSGG